MPESIHLSDQTLEHYYLNKIPAAEVKQIEEHLFDCGKCLDKLDATHRAITGRQTRGAAA
jgi:hypothetical protein